MEIQIEESLCCPRCEGEVYFDEDMILICVECDFRSSDNNWDGEN